MDQLKQAVSAAFDNVVASGAIEQAIEAHIAKSITSAIADQFSTYGDFSKAIKAKVSSLVDVNLDQIDLPSYRDLVGKIIRERVGAVMTEQFTTMLEKDIGELLDPAPASITLEQLLEDFIETQLNGYRGDDLRGNDFTLIIERDRSSVLRASNYAEIYLDAEGGKDTHNSAIHIRLRGDGEVWGLNLNGTSIKDKLFVGPMYNFEKRLFQMYTAKTKLILAYDATADDFNTTFPYGD